MKTRIALVVVGLLAGAGITVLWFVRPQAREIPPSPSEPVSGGIADWYSYLAGRRLRNLALLEGYVDHGRFPMNQELKFRIPLFLDRAGTACAIAELMLKDGKQDTVSRISKESNQVLVRDVREGPLVDWILRSGFTQEECSLIQPSYDYKAMERAHQNRVRRYLRGVIKDLRQETHQSLEIACRRLLRTLGESDHRGFVLERPGRVERAPLTRTARRFEARLSFLDGDGVSMKTGPWVSLGGNPGYCYLGIAEERYQWWLIEWRCQEPVEEEQLVFIDSEVFADRWNP